MKTTPLAALLWVPKLIAALIMLQTLYFKFSAAPESVYIFSAIGMEPFGRIGIGVLELVASVLILIPGTALFGSMLGISLMSGALFFHLTRLGIVVQNDGGLLFIYALAVLICCIILVYVQRTRLLVLIKKLKPTL
jgi:uncharacterized membrane protein YphA (DoxX/SURF4 family)